MPWIRPVRAAERAPRHFCSLDSPGSGRAAGTKALLCLGFARFGPRSGHQGTFLPWIRPVRAAERAPRHICALDSPGSSRAAGSKALFCLGFARFGLRSGHQGTIVPSIRPVRAAVRRRTGSWQRRFPEYRRFSQVQARPQSRDRHERVAPSSAPRRLPLPAGRNRCRQLPAPPFLHSVRLLLHSLRLPSCMNAYIASKIDADNPTHALAKKLPSKSDSAPLALPIGPPAFPPTSQAGCKLVPAPIAPPSPIGSKSASLPAAPLKKTSLPLNESAPADDL